MKLILKIWENNTIESEVCKLYNIIMFVDLTLHTNLHNVVLS